MSRSLATPEAVEAKLAEIAPNGVKPKLAPERPKRSPVPGRILLGTLPEAQLASCGHPTWVLKTLGNRRYRCPIDGEIVQYSGPSPWAKGAL